jgi:26S proteasome regulatory subunit T5
MSTLEELDDLDRREQDDKKDKDNKKDGDKKKQGDGDAEMKDAEPEVDDVLDAEILSLSTEDIKTRRRLLENDARIMKSEYQRLSHEKATMLEKIKENKEKIANNRCALSHDGLAAAMPCVYFGCHPPPR